jgi:hypothetical protein
MDRNQYAAIWEVIRSGFGIYLIYLQGDWFGASAMIPGIQYILIGYFILSMIVAGYFVIKHKREDRQQLSVA